MSVYGVARMLWNWAALPPSGDGALAEAEYACHEDERHQAAEARHDCPDSDDPLPRLVSAVWQPAGEPELEGAQGEGDDDGHDDCGHQPLGRLQREVRGAVSRQADCQQCPNDCLDPQQANGVPDGYRGLRATST
jgi:hypothetical protein